MCIICKGPKLDAQRFGSVVSADSQHDIICQDNLFSKVRNNVHYDI